MNENLSTIAAQNRTDIQAYAGSIGINEDYISTLVDTFYARLLEDPELGPIFAHAIADTWDEHMDVIKRFWSSVALNTGTYKGRPIPAHAKHPTIKPHHFATWLTIFQSTVEDTCSHPSAVPYLMERANRIAESLQLALFGIFGTATKY